jgi:hypothetical protein
MKQRVLVAHPIGLDDIALNALREEIATRMRPLLDPGVEVEVTLGRDDFQRNMPIFGSWEAWAQAVAEGATMTLAGPEPRYHGFVVAPYATIGKATAGIVNRALARGKTVLHYADGVFRQVRNVVLTDPEDSRAGWRVE